MACYHPLIAYARRVYDGDLIAGTATSWKRELHFVKQASIEFDAPFVLHNGHVYDERLEIPCGHCIGCRMAYAREWALRCILEAKQWPINYFLTITYSDECLPFGDYGNPSLRKKDLQVFMKLLRRECEYHFGHTGIRFYCCGEYGTHTHRPHYHMILFNAPELTDKVERFKNELGHTLFSSEFLDKIWKKGYIVFGDVTYESCCYTARYMIKKHKGEDASYYDDLGIEPEFTNCSRKPGIGFEYFDSNKAQIYKFDEIIPPGTTHTLRPPRYFDKLYDLDDHAHMCEIKDQRSLTAQITREQVLAKTDLRPVDYLALQELNKLEKLKLLPRNYDDPAQRKKL